MQNVDISLSVGGRIRQLRKREGMTTRTLAKNLNVSQQQLSRYERGVNKIDVCFIYRLCVFFNVSAEYFFENISNEINYITIDDNGLVANNRQDYFLLNSDECFTQK